MGTVQQGVQNGSQNGSKKGSKKGPFLGKPHFSRPFVLFSILGKSAFLARMFISGFPKVVQQNSCDFGPADHGYPPLLDTPKWQLFGHFDPFLTPFWPLFDPFLGPFGPIWVVMPVISGYAHLILWGMSTYYHQLKKVLKKGLCAKTPNIVFLAILALFGVPPKTSILGHFGTFGTLFGPLFGPLLSVYMLKSPTIRL